MRTAFVSTPTESVFASFLSPMRPAIRMLVKAWVAAVRHRGDIRQFAISYGRLRSGELSDTDVRLLLRIGAIVSTEKYIGHFLQGTHPSHDEPLTLPPRARFYLTPAGVNLLLNWFAAEAKPLHVSLGKPYWGWDGTVRALFYAGFLVKRFRGNCSTQEAVIKAFDDSRWPVRIGDPWASAKGFMRKERLNDTIRNLNENMAWDVIDFHGDGSALGICWRSLLGCTNELR